MEIQIRDAEPKDATSIVQLIAELSESDKEKSPVTDAYVRAYLSYPNTGILLAQVEDTGIGLLSYSIRPNLYHAGNSCLIEELVVSREWRGRGVGGALMDAFFKRVETLQVAEVSVSTMQDNEGALRFYRKYGMVNEAILLEKHFEGETFEA
jgi:ribosomal protein S18 acetylase RimI-like enzyme